MPGYFDDDEDQVDQQSGPKALRDQLKKLEKQLADLTKDLEVERKTNAELNGKLKSTTLHEAVRSAGIDVKYAKFVDLGDAEPSKEAVEKWAADNREIYAFLNNPAPASQEDEGEDVSGEVPDDALPPELVAALSAGQRLEQTGRPSGSADTITQLAGMNASNFKSRDDLVKALEALGAPLG